MSLPAGRYYIGDPCYAIGSDASAGSFGPDTWEDACERFITRPDINGNKFYGVMNGEYQLPSGRMFAIYSTKYGDGTYPGSDRFNYPVDSGSIGCVQLKPDEELSDPGLGTVVEFSHSFETYSVDGVIHIGHISINTEDLPHEEDEDDEY